MSWNSPIALWIVRVLVAIAVLVVGFWLARRVENGVKRFFEKTKVDPTLIRFSASAARWAFLVLIVISCLGALGLRTTSFAAVLGASALAIGLALQGTLANLACGVLLLVLRPFKVGDTVRAGGEMGSVVEIGLFTTLLDTPDNRRLVVPNRSVFNGNIENVSFHARRRIDLDIGVGYEADLDATRAALEAAAAAVEGRLEDPAPVIVLNGLGASAVNWQVRVWAPTPAFLAVRQAALRQIKRTLDEQGLSIPFPQMDVHLRREAANGG